jgi:two-component system response regulator HydG
MDQTTILAIDDQPETLRLISETLAGPGRRVLTFQDPQEALRAMEDRCVDLVLTDLRMPQLDGLEVLKNVKARDAETEVILLTAYADIDAAVQAMKQGAAEFLTKPLRLAELAAAVGKLLELQTVRRRLRELSGDDLAPVGTGDAMRRLLGQAGAVAETDSTVLIVGETGSGKEVLANYIQRHSARAGAPFVKVNCAALPESLLESELFGHERGAFTGASERRIGRFERANRGTLFLDEIAEMPLPMQVRFLRVLQEREIERVGGSQAVPVDFRLICATHRDLESMVAAGAFREDLYYRIHVFPMRVPPLRERPEDIPALACHFLSRARNKLGRGPAEFHADALAMLQQRPWPGNVRELENAIERACVLAGGTTLLPKHLTWLNLVAARHNGTPHAASPPGTPPAAGVCGSRSGLAPAASGALGAFPACPALPAALSSPPHHLAAPPVGSACGVPWSVDVDSPLEEAEKVTLWLVLDRCDWSFKQAAEKLKLSRSTLYAKVNRYGLLNTKCRM